MTAAEALDAANAAEPGERLRRYEMVCGLLNTMPPPAGIPGNRKVKKPKKRKKR